MPQKVLRFAGINRRINEYQNSGTCEELINLRPEIGGGHSIVKPKRVEEPTVSYDMFYEHSYGDVYNRIAVTNGVVQWINPASGGRVTITSEFASSDVSLSHAGNILVIYCEEKKQQLVFKFEDEQYKSYSAISSFITDAEVIYDYDIDNPPYYDLNFADYDSGDLGNLIGGFYNKYPRGLCGVSVIGCTYELEDGTEIWSTAFVVANVERLNGYKEPTLSLNMEGVNNWTVNVYGAQNVKVALTLNVGESSNVRRINVYASKPIFPYQHVESTSDSYLGLEKLPLKDMRLDGQLMYYQGSVSLDKSYSELTLNFGKEMAGEQVMPVTSGVIERTGRVCSYNNRFHYYRSEMRHIIQPPTVSDNGHDKDDTSFWIAYVLFDDEWKLVDNIYQFSESLPNDFIYPMSTVKRLAFVKAQAMSGGNIAVPYDEMFYVDLTDSSAYNYSYAFDVTPSIVSAADFYVSMAVAGEVWGGEFSRDVMFKNESNAINVSAQYNPFAFPVEYSYSFGGEILDIATSYLPISSTQVGQYPLSIFTSNGIYALEQGGGDVLYSNIVPVQPLVIDGYSVSTPFGIFFVSSKSLYLLSGQAAANISDMLDGEMELTLRELDSYQKLCCNSNGYFFNFGQLLSGEDFKQFIDGATLAYDQLRNEVHISSGDTSIPYSYVFNIDTKTYHKVAGYYLPAKSGSRYVIEAFGSSRNLIDLYSETDNTDQNILLQSRPLSLEFAFTHIQRLVLLVDSVLKDDSKNLCFSVFASDNLYDWKCVISSQKRDVILRQIRTNRAAKSYRDYVILITGTIDTNSNISDIIADYSIVNRRLG